jgi:PmbA protein
MIVEKYRVNSDEISVKAAGSEISSVRKKNITKTGIRVYDGKHVGVSGWLGEVGEKTALTRAKAALSGGIDYPFTPAAKIKDSRRIGEKLFDDSGFILEMESLAAWLKKEFPQFIFSSPGLKMETSSVSLSNDTGLDLRSEISAAGIEFLYKLKTSGSIMDGYFGHVGKNWDMTAYKNYAAGILSAHLNEIALPAEGKMPVVFSTGDGLILGKLIRELNPKIYGSGASLFSGKSGHMLFSEKFSVFHSRNMENIFLPFFDAEGTIPEHGQFAFIKNGIFISPYTDKRYAAQYGLPLTAAAEADYDGIPQPSIGRLEFGRSGKTIKELLGGRKAVFVLIASGGDYTPDGGFGTPVQTSFLFDGEKLLGRLPELQLKSHLNNMFGGDFIGVSEDPVMPLSTDRYLAAEMEVRRL